MLTNIQLVVQLAAQKSGAGSVVMLLCWSARVNRRAASGCCMQRRDDHCEQCAFWSHAYCNPLELSSRPACMLLPSRLGICHKAHRVRSALDWVHRPLMKGRDLPALQGMARHTTSEGTS